MKRRDFIQLSSIAGLAVATGNACQPSAEKFQQGKSHWPVCLNTSTIRPSTLDQKIKAAVESGYDGIELWINELEEYEKTGGNLKELGQQIRESGLFIPNIIGLWGCMPMAETEWQESLPATRERMRCSAEVGSKHVAAIPLPDVADFELITGVKRYKELLKIAREEYGIIAAFEFVGFFKGISRLGQAAAIALDTDDPDACIIMDTFHLYRGGSGYNGIKKLNGNLIANFHWNDLPDAPAREALGDEHRIFPGDGILPLVQVLRDLKAI
ncbi:MAG: sugar phosphate isomerase/epimerase, partial [Calditrichales bacterium]